MPNRSSTCSMHLRLPSARSRAPASPSSPRPTTTARTAVRPASRRPSPPAQTGYTILGIGGNAAQAFTPYTTTIRGEHIAIIAATQVIDSDLQTAWTATATQAGLASAYDVTDLVAAVEAARRTADTVIVYLHWGTELDPCPNPLQEPLAQALVKAGADIVVGTHARPPRRGLPRFGLRRLRPGQLRLLRQLPAGERQRFARRHRDGAAHRRGDLAAGRDRRRPSPASRGRRRHPGAHGVEPGPGLHRRHPHPRCSAGHDRVGDGPGAGVHSRRPVRRLGLTRSPTSRRHADGTVRVSEAGWRTRG